MSLVYDPVPQPYPLHLHLVETARLLQEKGRDVRYVGYLWSYIAATFEKRGVTIPQYCWGDDVEVPLSLIHPRRVHKLFLHCLELVNAQEGATVLIDPIPLFLGVTTKRQADPVTAWTLKGICQERKITVLGTSPGLWLHGWEGLQYRVPTPRLAEVA